MYFFLLELEYTTERDEEEIEELREKRENIYFSLIPLLFGWLCSRILRVHHVIAILAMYYD